MYDLVGVGRREEASGGPLGPIPGAPVPSLGTDRRLVGERARGEGFVGKKRFDAKGLHGFALPSSSPGGKGDLFSACWGKAVGRAC